MKKLNIYGYGGNEGVGWYRIHSPLRMLKKLDLAEIKTSEYRWSEGDVKFPTIDELADIGEWADIILFQRHDLGNYIAVFGALSEMFNIPFLLDTDDNVRFVRPWNPGYRGYNPQGEAQIWNRKVFEKVHGVIVSTDELKRFHAQDHKYITVCPNSLDMSLRDNLPIGQHPGEIRIGFLGSAAHTENLKPILPAVYQILREYPQTVFYLQSMYGNFWKVIPEDVKSRVREAEWKNMKEWGGYIAGLGLDIGLAPLADNMFNRAKSNLRWIEYSINKTAVIVSPVEAYKNVIHSETGMIAKEPEEWYENLKILVENETLRKQIGENAYKSVKENYNLEKNCILWLKVFEETIKRYKRQKGKKLPYTQSKEQIKKAMEATHSKLSTT